MGLLVACLLKCNADVRRLAANNIVLTGGGAELPGISLHFPALLYFLSRSSLIIFLLHLTKQTHDVWLPFLLVGLPETICEKLSSLLNNTAETKNVKLLRPLFLSSCLNDDADQPESIIMPSVVETKMAQHSFPKSSMNWIGGSLFASIKVPLSKYCIFVVL